MPNRPKTGPLAIRRRPHYKSRTGCKKCKDKRCDEQHPSCVNCLKRGVRCDYIQQAAEEQAAEDDDPDLVIEKPPYLDLEMFHQFCALTAYTLSTRTPVCDMWRIHVPQLALGADYVMDGILALAALHKAYQEPDRRESLLYHATRYHSSSLEKGLPFVSVITPQNGSSLYIFSMLTLLFNLARPRRRDDSLILGAGLFPEALQLMRGTHLIRESHHALEGSPVSLVFQGTEAIYEHWLSHVPNEHPALSELSYRITMANGGDAERQRILLEAIQALSRSYTFRDETYSIEEKMRGYYTWLYQISEYYLNLLSEGDNEAMCILVFFGPLVHDLEASSWWVEGWSFHIMQEVYSILEDDFKPWISWPMGRIGWKPPSQDE